MNRDVLNASGRNACGGPVESFRPFVQPAYPLVEPEIVNCAGYTIVRGPITGCYVAFYCGKRVLRTRMTVSFTTAHTKCARCTARNRKHQAELHVYKLNALAAKRLMLFIAQAIFDKMRVSM